MPRTATASAVETRTLAPPDSGADNALLYREAPQIVGEPQMRTSFVLVSPEQARQWLYEADKAHEEGSVKQRPLSPRDIRRWQILIETNRFVQFLPDGPLCFDEQGVLINGRHRLSAVGHGNKTVGFMVVKNVPRWMFRFFDTPKVRTLKDVFEMAARATKAQTGSTMRLAMRYEEFLHGKRGQGLGWWKDWGAHRDESYDVDEFLSRREELSDWYYVGQQIYSGSKVLVASAMAFRFYQSLAWPEGEDQLVAFCEGLAKGAMLAKGHPALVMREWARTSFSQKERIQGKRELHLLLLFRMFELTVQGDRIHRVQWARGFPMRQPYHPDGHEVATKNVLKALAEMDSEALGVIDNAQAGKVEAAPASTPA